MQAPLEQRRLGRADVWCVVLIVAILTLAFLPILASLDGFPIHVQGNDWYKYCALNRPTREAILRDHQFPLRTHYLGGGYPLTAYPEGSSLSPLFVPILLLGENVGLKLQVFIKLLAGGLGMYYLLRVSLGCPPGAGALGALMLGLSHWFHGKIALGYINHMNYFFVPLMMALLLDAVRGRRSIVLPALVFAVMLVDGTYVAPVSLLFLCLWGLPETVQFSRGRIVFRFAFLHKLAIVVGVGCLLAMVKILPMLELLSLNPRVYPYNDLGRPWATYGSVFYDLRALRMALEIPSPSDQAFIGLGWVPVGLALLSAVVNPRSLGRWVLLLLLFGWLCMGFHAPIDLWRFVWHLPVFHSMNKPAFSINFFLLMPLCVLAACLFRGRVPTRRARIGYGLYLCVGAVGVALLLQNAWRLNAHSFTETLDVKREEQAFFQVKGNGRYHTYQNMVQGRGTIDWDGDILLPECAVPKFFVEEDGELRPNEQYRGEVWCIEGGGAPRLKRLTANAIDVEVDSPHRASIIVNQNFHPGWHSLQGTVVPYRGLVAVAGIPGTGPRVVQLRYWSLPFSIGLAITAASLALTAWIALKRLQAYGVRRCLAGGEPPAGRRGREVRIAFGVWRVRTRLVVGAVLAGAVLVLLLLAIPPIRADYVLHSADLLYFAGDRDRAVELCRGVLRRYPDSSLAHEILGACAFEEGRWDEVVAEMSRARRSGAIHPQSYAQVAMAYENLGQLEAAKRAWYELITETPYNRGVWDMLKARGLIPTP